MADRAGGTAAAASRELDDITAADSPLRLEDVMASPVIQRISTPAVAPGGPAHDFALEELDLSSGVVRPTGRTFHLAERAGQRPVALIFGSYT